MQPTNSYFLRFKEPESNLDSNGFFVTAMIGQAPDNSTPDASPHTLQVDTGSCGIAIGIQNLSGYYQQQVKAQGPATMLVKYLPSNNEVWGWLADLPVVLFGPEPPPPSADLSAYPVTTVSVMVADHVMLGGKTQQPFGGGMMGIGFHADVATVMASNPLLSVKVTGQALSAGYVITPEGIDIGLTASNTAGFSFADLVPGQTSNPALPPPYIGPDVKLTVSYNGTVLKPLTCDLLMDTGVQRPMLFTEAQTIPANFLNTGSDAVAGPEIYFAAGATFKVEVAGGVCGYTFTLGDASPFTPPNFMLMNRAGPTNSLNASIYLLGGYNYCLDYANKRMGFQKRS